MDKDAVRVIGFDADDTLWVNYTIFQDVAAEFADLLSRHTSPEVARARLLEVEAGNLELYGYGIKGFLISMVEAAVDLTDGAVTGAEIGRIIEMGKGMISRPMELLGGVEEVLEALQADYKLMLITKGDLFDQESKVARSNLSGYFSHIEILSEKDEAAYEKVLERHRIPREAFLMIGNSLKSDVMPVVNIGAQAVHVPYHTTWEQERMVPPAESERPYVELDRIEDVLPLLSAP